MSLLVLLLARCLFLGRSVDLAGEFGVEGTTKLSQ